ncbi:MAG: sensor histidine kinase [Verrucomicrobiales bacterium]|nr:sensor histidine kinase [Verrucomicrobiales bacterium]
MTISRRLLLHVGFGAAVSIAAVTGVTYWLIRQESERLVIERLDTYVGERVRREQGVFDLVARNLETARSLYLSRHEQPIPADIGAQWDALVRRDPDGGWRSLRERGDPSVWGHRDLSVTPPNQHRLLNALRVCADLKPVWEKTFPSLYMSFPGSACIGFNPWQLEWAWDTPSDFDLEGEEWYYAATPEHNPGRGFVWTAIYPDPTSGLPYATVMLPIYSREGEFLCTLAHDMHLDILVSETTKSDFPGASHFIVRKDGRLIAHPDYRNAIMESSGQLTVDQTGDPVLSALVTTILAREEASVSGFDPASGSYFAASRLTLPSPDWIFVTQLPITEVRARALRSAQWVGWSGLALLGLLLTSLAGILRRQLSRPLAELKEAAEVMTEGREPLQAPVPRSDELDDLAQAFRRLMSRVRERELDLLQLNVELESRVEDRTTELAKALDRERQLSRIKSDFVSLVSHEFRTPLGVIMSAADVLIRYFERLPAEKRRRHLEMITRSTANLSSLIDEVLMLGRFEEGKVSYDPQPVDLEACCRRLADELRSATGGVCPIHVSTEGSLAGAEADEALLRHILANLLSNACKYSAPGTPIRFSIRREGDLGVFEIGDRGIGIPETDLPRLFGSFVRGSNVGDRPGSGLGLVLVERCVKLHGGKLDLKSVLGQGTTVTVHLPLFAEAAGNVPILDKNHQP